MTDTIRPQSSEPEEDTSEPIELGTDEEDAAWLAAMGGPLLLMPDGTIQTESGSAFVDEWEGEMSEASSWVGRFVEAGEAGQAEMLAALGWEEDEEDDAVTE